MQRSLEPPGHLTPYCYIQEIQPLTRRQLTPYRYIQEVCSSVASALVRAG